MALGHLRVTLRAARQSPLLAAVVVLTLSAGVAVTTAVFGLVNAVWFEPLPYPEPDRLTAVHEVHPREGYAERHTAAVYESWRGAKAVNALGAYAERTFSLGRPGIHAERVRGVTASASLFQMLEAHPLLGRRLAPRDEAAGAQPVALVSERFWRQRLSSSRDAVGTTVRLDGVETTIVGMLPYAFRLFNSGFDVFIPLTAAGGAAGPTREHAPGSGSAARVLSVIGRLAPNATAAAAAGELEALRRADSRAGTEGWQLVLRPLDDTLRGSARQAYLMLLAASTLLLLLVCGNVSNLLLARSVSRRREFGIRLALGAGRGRILRQLLAEGLLLACVSGALAFTFCAWLRQLLVATYPEMADLRIDCGVFAFVSVVSLLVGCALGLVPALSLTRGDADRSWRPGPEPGFGRKHRAGRLLAAGQLAAAATLLIGSGLLVKGSLSLRSTDPGFDERDLLTAAVSLPPSRYPSASDRRSFVEDVELRLAALPGARAAAACSRLPLDGGVSTVTLRATRRAGRLHDARVAVAVKAVSSAYFRTLGTTPLAGSLFAPGETQPVAVVNRVLARRLWGGDTRGLGESISLGDDRWWRIVGVVGDVRQLLTEPPAPEVYIPIRLDPPAAVSLIVKTTASPGQATGLVRDAVGAVDPDLALADVWTMREIVDSYVPAPFVGAFALLSVASVVLGGLGLYALVAFQVARRTREFGVRSALGADRARLIRQVLGEGFRLTVAGLAAGVVLSAILGLALSRALLDVGAFDPLVAAAAAGLLAIVSASACVVPALRAARVDPAVALRCE